MIFKKQLFIFTTILLSLSLAKAQQFKDITHITQWTNRLVKVEIISGLSLSDPTFFDFFQFSSDQKTLVPVDNFQNPAFYFWRGVCLGQASTKDNSFFCERTLNLLTEQLKAKAAIQGQSVDESTQNRINEKPPFESLTFKTSYSFLSTEMIEVTTKLFDPTKRRTDGGDLKPLATIISRASIHPKYRDYQIKFGVPSSNTPKRIGIESISPAFDKITLAVAQARLSNKINLGISTIDKTNAGTIFFISKLQNSSSQTALAITNFHVIAEKKECLIRIDCDIELYQSRKNQQAKRFTAKMRLMTADPLLDFALIQIDNIPQDFNFEILKFDSPNIGPNFRTFGYPTDKMGQLGNNEFQLIQSEGVLTSFLQNTMVTSIYSFQGASGSPILNENFEVVGLVSNSIDDIKVDGVSTTIARPTALIEKNYQISQYLSGEKQKRVQSLINQLIVIESEDLARSLVQQLRLERTNVGLDQIKNLMIEHKVLNIRKTLAGYLEAKGIF